MRRDHDSNWRHLWLGLPLLIVLAFVEGSGRLRFGQARVAPDLVLSVVIAWAFLTDSVHGAIWGFVGGLALDGIATTPFPLYTVALTAAGIAVGVGRLSLYADDRVWALVAGLVGSGVFYLVLWLGLLLSGWRLPWLETMLRIVLPAIAIDCVGVIVAAPILRRASRRLYHPVLAV